jgi:hypothetical protein
MSNSEIVHSILKTPWPGKRYLGRCLILPVFLALTGAVAWVTVAFLPPLQHRYLLSYITSSLTADLPWRQKPQTYDILAIQNGSQRVIARDEDTRFQGNSVVLVHPQPGQQLVWVRYSFSAAEFRARLEEDIYGHFPAYRLFRWTLLSGFLFFPVALIVGTLKDKRYMEGLAEGSVWAESLSSEKCR